MFGLSQGATTAFIILIAFFILVGLVSAIAYTNGEKNEIKKRRKKEEEERAEKRRRERGAENNSTRCPYCGGTSFGFSHDDFDSYELVCNKCGRKM
jgi:hypothetical protein